MLPLTAQRTFVEHSELITIGRWCTGWLSAKRAESLSPRTLDFYRDKIGVFLAYCESRHVKTLDAIDATLIREWLVELEQQGHNPGGIHGFYRTQELRKSRL